MDKGCTVDTGGGGECEGDSSGCAVKLSRLAVVSDGEGEGDRCSAAPEARPIELAGNLLSRGALMRIYMWQGKSRLYGRCWVSTERAELWPIRGRGQDQGMWA